MDLQSRWPIRRMKAARDPGPSRGPTKKAIHANSENGVFRPTTPVNLPEGSEVTVEPRQSNKPAGPSPHQKRIDQLLSPSEHTDDPHLSERHNEDQQ